MPQSYHRREMNFELPLRSSKELLPCLCRVSEDADKTSGKVKGMQ